MNISPLSRVGRIGLGCATFGREIAEDQAFAVMDHAVKLGIRLFDTAEAYGGGQARLYRKNTLGADDVREESGEMHSSEKIVGRWMKSRVTRSDIVLLTKVTTNFTRDHVRQALSASLERLQTDAVDLYLYHSFDAATPVEEACLAMNDAVRSGRVRAAGCSNYSGAQIEEALALCESQGLAHFEVAENAYSLVSREIELDLLAIAARRRIGVLTYSPLAAGFLLGKYSRDRSSIPKGTRFDVIPGHADVYFNDRNFRAVDRLKELAVRAGLAVERFAMAWVLQNPAVDTVLVGARTTRHLDNAVEAVNTQLRREWLAEIDRWE